MGNSKSKSKPYYLYEDDYLMGYMGNQVHPTSPEEDLGSAVDFNKLPIYTLPEFLKDAKKVIESKKVEFDKKKTFDVSVKKQNSLNSQKLFFLQYFIKGSSSIECNE